MLNNAGPGSIIVMHDSVETRGQTLAALPAILDGLKQRQLKTVTVSRLLGGGMVKAH